MEKQDIGMMESQNIDLQDKTEDLTADSVEKTFTEEEFQHEFDYFVAQQMLEKLLGMGDISVDVFNKITEKNRQTFSPLFIRDNAENDLILSKFRANIVPAESEVR